MKNTQQKLRRFRDRVFAVARCKGCVFAVQIRRPRRPLLRSSTRLGLRVGKTIPRIVFLRRSPSQGSNPFCAKSKTTAHLKVHGRFMARCKGFVFAAQIRRPRRPLLRSSTRLGLRVGKTIPRIVFLRRSPSQGSNPFCAKSKTTAHLKVHGRFMARCKGFEPLTFWFVAKHSIQLS